MKPDKLKEKYLADRAINPGPVNLYGLLYNSDGTIKPKKILVALGLMTAIITGAVVVYKKDEISSVLSSYFDQYIKHGKNLQKENLTNISDKNNITTFKNNMEKENTTELSIDHYDSIKDMLRNVSFLNKDGNLVVDNKYNRSVKDYLATLINDPAFVEVAQYVTAKPHKRNKELTNLSFSKFGETNFNNLDIGNVSFYHPPHYIIEKMNLTKYGFSEYEQNGISIFHLKPGKIIDATSSETEQELVSPEEAYEHILNLTNDNKTLKTVGTDSGRNDFAAFVLDEVYVESAFYGPNQKIIILYNGAPSDQKRESILKKFRTTGGSTDDKKQNPDYSDDFGDHGSGGK